MMGYNLETYGECEDVVLLLKAWARLEKEYNTLMEMEDIEIGLSGFGVGPFPDRSRIGPLVNQWRLLPLAKMLGFDEEALTSYMVEFLSLFSGASVNDFAKRFRNDFLPHWTDLLLMAPSLAERSASPQDESPDAKNSDAQRIPCLPCTSADSQTEFPAPSKMPPKRNISMTNGRTLEEKAVDVLELFIALYAYLASVEKAGLDAANAFSLKVHTDLFKCPSDILLDLPGFFAELQRQNPSQFTRLLRQYPDDDDDTSIFQGATVFIPQEQKTINFCDFVKGLRDHSIAKPDRYYVIPAKKPERPKKRRNADLHDAGCYLESLILSLLVGREDFITKGVILSVAQDEGLAIMDGSYAELGGEQGVAESLAQGHLCECSQGIIAAPMLEGESLNRTQKAVETLQSLMVRFKKESTKELKEVQRLDKLTKPVSLDTEVEDEEGGITSLSECLPAEQDLLEAVDRYYEAVLELPEDVQPIFRRVWEEGETLKQAALNLGYDWTSTLERQVERMIRKIRSKMTE